MGIVSTDIWLNKSDSNPITFCEKLEPYFQSGDARIIHRLLTINGMSHNPTKVSKTFIEHLPDVFNIVKKEQRTLMKEWNGPDIPIIILPSDPNNRKIVYEFNGKSGLAFKDKLLLFLSDKNTKYEIKALLTHEYNHVCRLTHYSKKEQDFTLLDTIILEGLAEYAVFKRLGEEQLAPWTSYYSESELQRFWKKFIQPNKDLSINHRKHQQVLYGLQFLPKMVGYAVGYYVVTSFMEKKHISLSDVLLLHSEEIITPFLDSVK